MEGKTEVSATCKECRGVETVHVDEVAWQRYLLREGLVTTMFPDLDDADRELVMNAARGGWFICRVCWPIVFAETDEQESE
jgi:hypothetical protein